LARGQSRQGWNPKQALLGRDRRIFERVALELPCRFENKLYGQQAQGSTVNISLGGVGLVAPVTWPEGSHIWFSIEGLSVEGLIVFRRPSPDGDPRECLYGVKFQNMRFKDLSQVRKLLRKHFHGPLAVL